MEIRHSYELRMTDTFILLLLFPTNERENIVGNSERYTTRELQMCDIHFNRRKIIHFFFGIAMRMCVCKKETIDSSLFPSNVRLCEGYLGSYTIFFVNCNLYNSRLRRSSALL